MTFEELQLEELNHIIIDLKQQLNYELRKNTMLNKQLDALVALGDKISHQNEEQQETIDELNAENTKLYIDNEKQSIEINRLYKDLEKANKEINRLKMIIELKDDARIELVEENTKLKKEINELYTLKNQLADDNNNLRETIKAYEQLFY